MCSPFSNPQSERKQAMSGHNKWSSIKHKKGAADAKRSKTFTKVIKEITVAARIGGEDPNANPRLRSAVGLAKSVNMPSDNIAKAIKKGVGGDRSENWETIVYEGYGPHNVAVIVECLTDNRNRTISSIRGIFSKHNGRIGATNSVMYMFDRLGIVEIGKSAIDEDRLMEYALESGAEDIETSDEELFVVKTDPSQYAEMVGVLERNAVPIDRSSIDLVPRNRVVIEDLGRANRVIGFIEALEDDEDVQRVYSNFDIGDEVLRQLG